LLNIVDLAGSERRKNLSFLNEDIPSVTTSHDNIKNKN
jgi:hypothetical protein